MIKNLRKLLLIALPIILLFSSIGIASAQEPDPTSKIISDFTKGGDNRKNTNSINIFCIRLG